MFKTPFAKLFVALPFYTYFGGSKKERKSRWVNISSNIREKVEGIFLVYMKGGANGLG